MAQAITLMEVAEVIQNLIDTSPQVKEWVREIEPGTEYNSGDWMACTVDPVYINYADKSISIGFSIRSRAMTSRVILITPFMTWKFWHSQEAKLAGLDGIGKAIRLCEFLWNEHHSTPENAVVESSITLRIR